MIGTRRYWYSDDLCSDSCCSNWYVIVIIASPFIFKSYIGLNLLTYSRYTLTTMLIDVDCWVGFDGAFLT